LNEYLIEKLVSEKLEELRVEAARIRLLRANAVAKQRRWTVVSAIVALGNAAVANLIRSIRRWPVIRKHAAMGE
jgi:hypothetical protein